MKKSTRINKNIPGDNLIVNNIQSNTDNIFSLKNKYEKLKNEINTEIINIIDQKLDKINNNSVKTKNLEADYGTINNTLDCNNINTNDIICTNLQLNNLDLQNGIVQEVNENNDKSITNIKFIKDYIEHTGYFDPSKLIQLTHYSTSLTTLGDIIVGPDSSSSANHKIILDASNGNIDTIGNIKTSLIKASSYNLDNRTLFNKDDYNRITLQNVDYYNINGNRVLYSNGNSINLENIDYLNVQNSINGGSISGSSLNVSGNINGSSYNINESEIITENNNQIKIQNINNIKSYSIEVTDTLKSKSYYLNNTNIINSDESGIKINNIQNITTANISGGNISGLSANISGTISGSSANISGLISGSSANISGNIKGSSYNINNTKIITEGSDNKIKLENITSIDTTKLTGHIIESSQLIKSDYYNVGEKSVIYKDENNIKIKSDYYNVGEKSVIYKDGNNIKIKSDYYNVDEKSVIYKDNNTIKISSDEIKSSNYYVNNFHFSGINDSNSNYINLYNISNINNDKIQFDNINNKVNIPTLNITNGYLENVDISNEKSLINMSKYNYLNTKIEDISSQITSLGISYILESSDAIITNRPGEVKINDYNYVFYKQVLSSETNYTLMKWDEEIIPHQYTIQNASMGTTVIVKTYGTFVKTNNGNIDDHGEFTQRWYENTYDTNDTLMLSNDNSLITGGTITSFGEISVKDKNNTNKKYVSINTNGSITGTSFSTLNINNTSENNTFAVNETISETSGDNNYTKLQNISSINIQNKNIEEYIINIMYPVGSLYLTTIELNGTKSYSNNHYYVIWMGCKWEFLYTTNDNDPLCLSFGLKPNGQNSNWYIDTNNDQSGGKSGGSRNYQISIGDTNGTAISVDQMPSHSHGGTATDSDSSKHIHTGTATNSDSSNHTHTGTATNSDSSKHMHSLRAWNWNSTSGDGNSYPEYDDDRLDWDRAWAEGKANLFHTGDGVNGANEGEHSHTLSIDSSGKHSHTLSIDSSGKHSHSLSINPTGSGQTHLHSTNPTSINVYPSTYYIYVYKRVNS